MLASGLPRGGLRLRFSLLGHDEAPETHWQRDSVLGR
jgi:hypothetical protein